MDTCTCAIQSLAVEGTGRPFAFAKPLQLAGAASMLLIRTHFEVVYEMFARYPLLSFMCQVAFSETGSDWAGLAVAAVVLVLAGRDTGEAASEE